MIAACEADWNNFFQDILNHSYVTCRDLLVFENCYMAMSQATEIQTSNAIQIDMRFFFIFPYTEIIRILNGIMTHCQKYALVCTLWYFTGDSPLSRGYCRSCQSNLGYAVIGQRLWDSAIGAVSTGVCLLNSIFISFDDAFWVRMFYKLAHVSRYICFILLLNFVTICWTPTIVLMPKVRIRGHDFQMEFYPCSLKKDKLKVISIKKTLNVSIQFFFHAYIHIVYYNTLWGLVNIQFASLPNVMKKMKFVAENGIFCKKCDI